MPNKTNFKISSTNPQFYLFKSKKGFWFLSNFICDKDQPRKNHEIFQSHIFTKFSVFLIDRNIFN